MDTLPSDLFTLLDTKLNPYETLLLHLNATNIDTRWLWYNYRRGILDFEIIKLCRKADKESVKILKDILLKGPYKPGNEQIFQMKMLALKTGDNLWWDMIPNFDNTPQGRGLYGIVCTESILYGHDNDLIVHPHITKSDMNMLAQCLCNALKVGNVGLFKRFMMISEIPDVDNILAIMLNPDQEFNSRSKALTQYEYQILLRWSIIINRLDLYVKIIKKIEPMNRFFDEVFECAIANNAHTIIEYVINMRRNKEDFLQIVYDLGYYYPQFWSTLANREPLLIHSLKLFQSLDDGEQVVVGTSMDRIELDNLKMLFELSPPSKRELHYLINIAKRHRRYDIYCYCWELIMGC